MILLNVSNHYDSRPDLPTKLAHILLQAYHGIRIPPNIPVMKDPLPTTWQIDSLLKAIEEIRPQLVWINVCRLLDHPGLEFVDQKSFIFLMKVFQRVAQYFKFKFPRSVLFDSWKNTGSQIHFLKHIFEIGDPALIGFRNYKFKSVSFDFNNNLKFETLNPPVLQLWAC